MVANEVKELAKETAKATEEIGQKIEAIQGDSKAAVAAIGEISSIINQINDVSSTIASAVEAVRALPSYFRLSGHIAFFSGAARAFALDR